jgi:hypothetical protein
MISDISSQAHRDVGLALDVSITKSETRRLASPSQRHTHGVDRVESPS